MKNAVRQPLVIVSLVGCAFSLAFVVRFIQQNSNLFVGRQVQGTLGPLTVNGAVLAEQEHRKSRPPVRLKIPKINVDAAVESVGLTPDGAMDVPKSPDDVAWFKLGRRPGETGSAVIAGHNKWKNGKTAVFDYVHTLRKGDTITIEDDKGMSTSFVVRESRRYDPNADAADVFGSQDGKAHLNLITCEGVWDTVSKSYSKRLVVFTDKE